MVSHKAIARVYARNVLTGPIRAIGGYPPTWSSTSPPSVIGFVRGRGLPVGFEADNGQSVCLEHRCSARWCTSGTKSRSGWSRPWLKDIVEVCDYFRITLRIVPEDLVVGQQRDLELIYHSDPLRLPEIVLRPKHLDSTALFFKRLIDIVISAAGLVILSPLFLVIAAAIKLTTPRLPVFYRWQVVGYNGRRFTGYKFTSMEADADSRKAELMVRNEMQGPVFKIRNDPRITSLGRYLRKFSLNELPQLWSVLKGDMSLVGPRPAFPEELERYEIWQKRKTARSAPALRASGKSRTEQDLTVRRLGEDGP